MKNPCKLCSEISLDYEEDDYKDYESDHAICDIDCLEYKLRLRYSEYKDGGIGNAYLMPEFKMVYETKYPVTIGRDKCGEFSVTERFYSDDYMMMFPINYCPICGRSLRHDEYGENRDEFVIIK